MNEINNELETISVFKKRERVETEDVLSKD